MHPSDPTLPGESALSETETITGPDGVALARRMARTLQRAAQKGELTVALPVLRRLLKHEVVPVMALPELLRQRHVLQRKHFLWLLAVEAGYANWDTYLQGLQKQEPAALAPLQVKASGAGVLKQWFANEADAQQFAQAHGGEVVVMGDQAVVI
jgi:hypothetical protein